MIDGFADIWQYMPHGMCLLWQPWLVVLWAGSDLLIFLSYSAIPIALLSVLRRRADIPFGGLVVLFASFILLCGLTHALSIVTLWYPIYPYLGAVKLVTGIVSTITAIVLFRLIPTLVALPSPAEMTKANERLREEVAAHERTMASLEAKVAERTEELATLNRTLSVQAREAVHRSANLLSVVSSLATQSARTTDSKEEFVETLIGRLQSLARATSLVMRGSDEASQQLETVVRDQLQPVLMAFPKQVAISGPDLTVGPEAAQQVSLALHELATNAQKHGLASESDARIDLSWSIAGGEGGEGDGNATFTLEWRETLPAKSAGAFSDVTSQGFGTKLLTRIVPAMLRGEARREFEGDLFRYRLIVPASAVLASRDHAAGDALAARLVDENFGLA